MIRTDEVPRIPESARQTLAPAMPATVQERMNRALAVADDDNGSMTHVSRNEIARLQNLGLVRQEDPGAVENPLHLQPAYVIADEDVPAHQPALNVDPIRVRRSL